MMIVVAMASIDRAVPVLVAVRLVRETTMGFSDPRTKSLGRIVPRAVLEESRVLGKPAPEMTTIILHAEAADLVLGENAAVVEHERTIFNGFVRRERSKKLISSSFLQESLLFSAISFSIREPIPTIFRRQRKDGSFFPPFIGLI
jgi:hypothetical protein